MVWERMAARDRPWDLLIVGGGITGAGLLLEATLQGFDALLVERHDFAWGSSSRSSKLVHGGFRYLKRGRLRAVRRALVERDRLLDERPGLVDPLPFLLAAYRDDASARLYGLGLRLYDLLSPGLGRRHFRRGPAELEERVPGVARDGLQGAWEYGDARTDDAGLVLRVLREGVARGGTALSYVEAGELLRRRDGRVVGAAVADTSGFGPEGGLEVEARVVVNATGPWADRLVGGGGGSGGGSTDREGGGAPGGGRIRPLRGSHLVLSRERVPLDSAFCFRHPADRRYVFAFPWEGVTLFGTTDLDHDRPLGEEPRASDGEVAYLLEALDHGLPGLGIGEADVLSTFAGVRPIVSAAGGDSWDEPRETAVWEEDGVVSVTGGKLTVFRRAAREVLGRVRHRLPDPAERRTTDGAPSARASPVDGVDLLDGLDPGRALRLAGRYGAEASALVAAAGEGELERLPGSPAVWAELRWSARAEGPLHLDDLLLRRARVGICLPGGGREVLGRVGRICREELGWDGERWEQERARYLEIYARSYGLPGAAAGPAPASDPGVTPAIR